MQRDRSGYPTTQESPFSLRRWYDQMDRLFDDFFGASMFGMPMLMPWWGDGMRELAKWPQIEISQQGSTFEIRADMPGLKKDDIKVEVKSDELCLSGERRNESERDEQGVYRTERSYGRFMRTIPLPPNADLESTRASFEDGVLTVSIDVPGVEEKGPRTIEVQEGKPAETRH
jgi:HSP20 family protein